MNLFKYNSAIYLTNNNPKAYKHETHTDYQWC